MPLHRRHAALTCLLLVAASAAAAAAPERLTPWQGVLDCGPNKADPSRTSFTQKLDFVQVGDALHASHVFRSPTAAEATLWSGQVARNQLEMKAVAQRNNGEAWTFRLTGPFVAGDRVVVRGGLHPATAAPAIRDCILELTRVVPQK